MDLTPSDIEDDFAHIWVDMYRFFEVVQFVAGSLDPRGSDQYVDSSSTYRCSQK